LDPVVDDVIALRQKELLSGEQAVRVSEQETGSDYDDLHHSNNIAMF